MTTPPADAYVAVAGLRVPAPLVPRILAAMRGTYPTVTEGLDDDAAVRAVLKHWVTTTLAAWEEGQIITPLSEQLAQIRAAHAQAERQAAEVRARAEAAAATITEADPASTTDLSL
jgi:hypothetical protein